jgi:diaminopimelate epimerase
MKFTKMHGLGNDYVVLDGIRQKIHLTPTLIRKLCDRHFGIGTDGVILILPIHKSAGADFRMQIFNADGSEAEMCGNGIRCLAKFVYDHGLTRKKVLNIQTLSGMKLLRLSVTKSKVKTVCVEMGQPIEVGNEGLDVTDEEFAATLVNIGNPHCVIFTRKIDKLPIERYGSQVECHSKFPNRTNVEFVEIIDKSNIKQRTWERGVGETLACGTGAAAAVVAGVHNKLLNRKVTVHLKGGNLQVDYTLIGNIYITGPAEEVFSGNINPLRN